MYFRIFESEIELSVITFINDAIFVCFCFMVISAVLMPRVVGKYFDQWFGDINPPLTIVFSPFIRYGRAQYYAMCIIFKNRSSSRILYPFYQGYDFRANARKIDIMISRIHFYSFVSAITLACIWNILSFFYG